MALRRLEIGIALSALLHGVAVAWAIAAKPDHKELPPDPIVEIEVVSMPPAAPAIAAVKPAVVVPIDVALVPDLVTAVPPPLEDSRPTPVAPAVHPPAGAAAVQSHPGPQPPEITQPGSGTGTVPDPNANGPAKPGILTMRQGPDLKSHVRGSYKDAYDLPECKPPDCTPPPPPAPTSGQLHESGGGTYTSDQGTFVVHVNPDGSAHISDAGNLGGGAAHGGRDSEGHGTGATGEQDGDLDRSGGVGDVGATAAHFDVTDALMRKYGQDPYAAAKLKVLDATRDERVEIGKRYKARQLKQTPAIVAKNLARLFARVPDTAGRKEALFEMWDETIDTGPDDAIAAGVQAKRLVIAAIRSHLPAGSADAYTAAELAAFNAHRSSKARFAPYE